MKTTPFSCVFVILLLFLCDSLNSFSQSASLSILKNGTKINPDDMSISRRDRIVIQIINTDSQVKYKISNLNLEVRTKQFQAVKTIEQARKYHKNITLSTDFDENPKIEIRVRDYSSRYVSRFLLKFILVEQLKEGEITKADWITYGKEYEFWYYKKEQTPL